MVIKFKGGKKDMRLLIRSLPLKSCSVSFSRLFMMGKIVRQGLMVVKYPSDFAGRA